MKSLLKKVITSFFMFFLISENQENIMLYPLVVLATTAGSSAIDDNLSEENKIDIKIRYWLSDGALYIFDSIDKKTFDDDTFYELESLNKHFENSYFSNEERIKLSDLSVLSLLIKKKLIKNNISDAKQIIEDIQSEYLSKMKERYNQEQYDSMLKDSYSFESQGKHASYCDPENVIIVSKEQTLKDFPIVYNDYILISLNDVIESIGKDYEIEYMKNNSNIIIKFGKDILEIEPGNSIIYINDSKHVLDNPVLSYKQRTFISTDIFDHLDSCLNNKVLKTVQIAKDNLNEPEVIIF